MLKEHMTLKAQHTAQEQVKQRSAVIQPWQRMKSSGLLTTQRKYLYKVTETL